MAKGLATGLHCNSKIFMCWYLGCPAQCLTLCFIDSLINQLRRKPVRMLVVWFFFLCLSYNLIYFFVFRKKEQLRTRDQFRVGWFIMVNIYSYIIFYSNQETVKMRWRNIERMRHPHLGWVTSVSFFFFFIFILPRRVSRSSEVWVGVVGNVTHLWSRMQVLWLFLHTDDLCALSDKSSVRGKSCFVLLFFHYSHRLFLQDINYAFFSEKKV